ncbi:MAG: aspartyl protease family protein [Cellulosilyticaceae bacterium]
MITSTELMESNVIQFSKRTFENLIFIPVTLNNITVIAMFDTGATMSLISESTVQRLGELQNVDSIKCGNNQGAVNTYETIMIDNVQIGNMLALSQQMVVLPDAALEFGEDSYHNKFPASMLLGWDIISQFGWEFEMNKNIVKIYHGGTMPKSDSLSWNNYPIIRLDYLNTNFSVGFDSGHTETILDNTWLSILPDLKSSETVVHGIGSKSTKQVNIAKKLTFTIGTMPITLYDVEVIDDRIHGAIEDSLCGLLGADVIYAKKWSLDYKSSHFKITN